MGRSSPSSWGLDTTSASIQLVKSKPVTNFLVYCLSRHLIGITTSRGTKSNDGYQALLKTSHGILQFPCFDWFTTNGI